jgi:hypothetical protein
LSIYYTDAGFKKTWGPSHSYLLAQVINPSQFA